ncbi:MAG: SlyX family protein [Parahaliea sp.]
MSDPDLLALLQDLQTQLAFQDDTIAALNDALAAQQRELLVLQRQLTLLKQRLDEQATALADLPAAGAASERPPHY